MNAGDRAFWFGAPGYISYRDTTENWLAYFANLISTHSITDIVLYGDTRPIHVQAVELAKAAGAGSCLCRRLNAPLKRPA